jgi:hypothetical protein
VLEEVVGFNVGLDYESMAKCWLCNIRFGVVNILSSEIVEVKKFLVFPGSGMEKHEASVGSCHANVEMLAYPSAFEADIWLRLCHKHAGEDQCKAADGVLVDRMCTT